jgi:hypothetical protein
MGSASSVAGFFSDGELTTGDSAVTINDANEAVLGSLTTLGSAFGPGALIAGSAAPGDVDLHFLLQDGRNVTGRGSVTGNFKNNGHVIGDGDLPEDRLQFDAGYIVTGLGSFENVQFNGSFQPGLSPGIVDGADITIAGKLEIELGGATPGNGVGHHDQVNDAGAFTVAEGATLALKSFGGYVPAVGQEFEIVTSSTQVVGDFAAIEVDPWFAAVGIGFEIETRAGTLVAQAIGLSADFTLDGRVDGQDLLLWQRTLGMQGEELAADGNRNGMVDGGDLDVWRMQFGAPNGAGYVATGAVPEPSAACLVLGGLLGTLLLTGQRSNTGRRPSA